jgi:DNA polymerase-3 subunit alpha
MLVNDELGRYIPATDIHLHHGKEIEVLGYLVTSKPVYTVKKETMYFHTFIDANGDWLDTIFFPDTATRYPVTGRGFYSMKGKVVDDFGVYSVEVSYCKKIGIKDRTEVGNPVTTDLQPGTTLSATIPAA